MDKEKIVVVLLLVTIILSIVSLIVTFSLNMPDRIPTREITKIINPSSSNAGDVSLVIEKPVGGQS